jgi:GH24 family phage-related lysozyme (muramidase)
MDMEKLRAEITFDEGRRRNPYKDSLGNYTGGVGHNLQAHGASWEDICGWMHAGIPDVVIDQWLTDDIEAAITTCWGIFPTFADLGDNRQRVLVNMAFDLEHELNDWHGLKAAIAAKDWTGASLAIMDSRFAHEAPNRCGRLAARMVEG